jgi:hypothetical protein
MLDVIRQSSGSGIHFFSVIFDNWIMQKNSIINKLVRPNPNQHKFFAFNFPWISLFDSEITFRHTNRLLRRLLFCEELQSTPPFLLEFVALPCYNQENGSP